MPISNGSWTDETITALYDLREKSKLSWKEIGIKLNKNGKSCQDKFLRMNWCTFLKNYSSKKKEKQTSTIKEIVDSS